MGFTTILLLIIGALVVWAVLAYNGLVRFRNRAQEAFSDIDVQLKRRFDLVPNLVNTVKGYAAHETSVFEKVTEARARVAAGGSLKDRAESENVLSQTLKTLFAVAENYPDLKANANFLELQRELSDTENKIQSARRFYNANVRDLNTRIETVPTNIIANFFNFKQMEFFEVESSEEKEPVKVAF